MPSLAGAPGRHSAADGGHRAGGLRACHRARGGLELLPVEITNVTGQEHEDSWLYTVARAGPMAT